MNKLEALVYQTVKQNPKIKNLVRDIYQLMLHMVPGPGEKSSYPVTVREGFFYGFHDKIPWSFDNKNLLAHGYSSLRNREPKKDDKVDVGFFCGDGYLSFQKAASTSCFNWQQGSMLQWVGKTDQFIFNDAGGADNRARIFDVEGQEMNVLPKAIAAVDGLGNVALAYNFARLQKHFPGYGYVHGVDPEMDVEAPTSHGISTINVQNNSVSELFSVKDIAHIKPDKSMSGAYHFLTHCQFSPSGKRFLFLHRWVKNENFTFTRMFSCDINGGRIHLFPTLDMVSHIAWQDDTHVLAYSRSKEGQDAYILFDDLSEEHKLIGTGDFNSDGHPMFAPTCNDWFITDTYPDRLRRSYLILYNLINEKRYDLGFFRQPLQYKEEVRCDLHPRWNRDGTQICFDSAHTGKRALCTMEIGRALSLGNIHSIQGK